LPESSLAQPWLAAGHELSGIHIDMLTVVFFAAGFLLDCIAERITSATDEADQRHVIV
jgi:hypothetical protein